MKSYTLSQNSWHYKLANVFGDMVYHRHDEIDICAYIRKLVLNAGVCVVLAIIASVVLYMVGSTLFWIGKMIYTLTAIAPEFHHVLTVLLTFMFGTIALVVKYIESRKIAKYNAERDGTSVVEDPSFIKLGYRKFKSKTCFKIEFK
jgi:hypothetical protein